MEVVEDEGGEVFEVVSEGWGVEGEDAEAIPEVGAECAIADFFLEVAIGGGDDADVDFPFFVVANAAECLFLEESEEEALCGEGKVSDFVEEEGAAMGFFDDTGGVVVGTGEGAFGIAEKAGFEEWFADDVAVEGNEGFVGAFGEAVEEDSDGFFAGAAFAEDDDVVIAGADEFDFVFEGVDGGGGADELAVAPFFIFGESVGVGFEEWFEVSFRVVGGEDSEDFEEEIAIGVVVAEAAGALFGHFAEFLGFRGEWGDVMA